MLDLNIIIISYIIDEERIEKFCKDIGKDKIFVFFNGVSILNIVLIIDRVDVYFGVLIGLIYIVGVLGKKIVVIYFYKKI